MISNLVSSLLNPVATAGAADKAAVHQLDDDKNRPIPSTGFTAKPVVSRLDRAASNRHSYGCSLGPPL